MKQMYKKIYDSLSYKPFLVISYLIFNIRVLNICYFL